MVVCCFDIYCERAAPHTTFAQTHTRANTRTMHTNVLTVSRDTIKILHDFTPNTSVKDRREKLQRTHMLLRKNTMHTQTHTETTFKCASNKSYLSLPGCQVCIRENSPNSLWHMSREARQHRGHAVCTHQRQRLEKTRKKT